MSDLLAQALESVDAPVSNRIRELVELKAAGQESTHMDRDLVLDRWLAKQRWVFLGFTQ